MEGLEVLWEEVAVERHVKGLCLGEEERVVDDLDPVGESEGAVGHLVDVEDVVAARLAHLSQDGPLLVREGGLEMLGDLFLVLARATDAHAVTRRVEQVVVAGRHALDRQHLRPSAEVSPWPGAVREEAVAEGHGAHNVAVLQLTLEEQRVVVRVVLRQEALLVDVPVPRPGTQLVHLAHPHPRQLPGGAVELLERALVGGAEVDGRLVGHSVAVPRQHDGTLQLRLAGHTRGGR
mmetsp:Transcript_8408/g.20573  ORF Transcript_8408/g.20573 Transcript_8408/m.20573 type:complete len:235 (-) Transcript_8408:112-816(-)